MAQYDGSFRINTKISTKDAKVQLSALQHTIVKTADEIASLRSRMDALKNVEVPTKEFTDLEAELKKAASEYDKLRAKMDNPGKPTEEYRLLQKQLQKAQSELERLAERQSEMEGMGLPLTQESINQLADASDRVDALKEKMQSLESSGKAFVPKVDPKELDDAKKKVDELKQKMKELESSGKDFQLGRDTDEYKSLERQLGYEQEALAKMLLQYTKLGGIKAFGKIKDSFKKLGKTAKNAFSNVDKSAKKSGGVISSFGSRIKGLVASALIFNQISKAFNAMSSGMKDGFGNLYKEVWGFKSSVDGLEASSMTLKNSLAAAFRPLVEVAIPYIQKAIEYITRLADSFGQLTAAVTGQKTYTKAIEQTTSALEGAKEAEEGYLSPLDEINKYQKKGGQSGSGGAPGTMFEEVPISDGFKELAGKAKDIFSGIFDVFKKSWQDKGESVIGSAKAAFGSILDVAKAIGATFYQVFTNGTGILWAESLLNLLRSVLDIIHSIASSFAEAWNSGAGFEHVSALFEMLMDVNDLLSTIGDSFSRVLSSGIGAEIWTNLLGILTGIYNIIGNIAEQITIAWTAAGTGDSIWNGILNIANIILGTLHDITGSTAIWASALDFTPLLQSIDTLLQSIQPLAGNIGEGLKWFWDNVLLPIAGWAIQDAVPVFLDMLSAAIGSVNEVVEALKPLGMWLWDEFLQPLGEWAGDTIIAAMETITGLLQKFGDWASENQEAVQNMVIIIGSFFAAWKLVVAVAGIVDFIKNIGSLIGIVQKMFGLIGTVFNPWTLAIGAVIAIGVLLWKNWDEISAKAKEVWEFVKKKFEEFSTWLKNVFETDWTEAFGAFGGILNGFLDIVGGIWDSIKQIFGGIIDFIAGVFTGDWERAWDGIVDIFKGIFNLIPSIVEGVINGAIDIINGIIGGINWATDIIGIPPIPEIPPVSIPRLATGAVIPPNKEFLAVLGDQKHGTNIEAPLDTIRQASAEAVMEVLSKLGATGNIGGSSPQTIIIRQYLDGRQVAESVVKEGKVRQMATGSNMFMLGTT